MLRFLLYAVPAVIVLYALIDAILTPREEARLLPKWLWLVLVVIVPLAGALAWLLAGRPRSESVSGGIVSRRPGPAAPDDDAAFLRTIDDATWSQRMRQRRESTPPPPPPPAPEQQEHPAPDGQAGSADSAGL